MKRDLKGLLNPNSDSLRKAKDLASIYNSSIDSKISVAKSHLIANKNIWVFIRASYSLLLASFSVLLIIVIELAV